MAVRETHSVVFVSLHFTIKYIACFNRFGSCLLFLLWDFHDLTGVFELFSPHALNTYFIDWEVVDSFTVHDYFIAGGSDASYVQLQNTRIMLGSPLTVVTQLHARVLNELMGAIITLRFGCYFFPVALMFVATL